MTLNHEKLKIGGLVVIALLLVLLSRQQRPQHRFVHTEPAPKVAGAVTENPNLAIGTISGSVTLPSKAEAKQLSVCAVNDSTRALYCKQKISKDFSIDVTVGTYTLFATMSDNPYDLNAYRAYYTEPDSHTSKKFEVQAGETIAGISPNDWSNLGSESIIALLNEQYKDQQRQLAYLRAQQEAKKAAEEQQLIDQTNLDVGGVPDSEQQSPDSSYTTNRHKNNN